MDRMGMASAAWDARLAGGPSSGAADRRAEADADYDRWLTLLATAYLHWDAEESDSPAVPCFCGRTIHWADFSDHAERCRSLRREVEAQHEGAPWAEGIER